MWKSLATQPHPAPKRIKHTTIVLFFYSALINNSFGTLGWCLNDFDFIDKRPYSHHPFEERFGIVKTDKSLKKAGLEFKKFSKICHTLRNGDYQKIENNVGLLIPSYYYIDYPYMPQPRFNRWYDFYLQCFSLMKRAGMEVECIYEPPVLLENREVLSPEEKPLDPQKFPLLFAPRLKFFTKKYWRKIVKYIESGGILYGSFTNDSWVLDWDKISGVEMDCKFGIPDFKKDDILAFKNVKKWGNIIKIEDFELKLDNVDPELSYCKTSGLNGELLIKDQDGEPVLVLNNYGKGKVYFSCQPVEMYSLQQPGSNWDEFIIEIYETIKEEIYQKNKIKLIAENMEMGIWQNQVSREYKIIIINHSWDANEGQLIIPESYILDSHNIGSGRIENNNLKFRLKKKEVLILDIKNE